MLLIIDRQSKHIKNKLTEHKLTVVGLLKKSSFPSVLNAVYKTVNKNGGTAVLYGGLWVNKKIKLITRYYKIQKEPTGKIFSLFYYPDGYNLCRDSKITMSFYTTTNKVYPSKPPLPKNASSLLNEYL
jgi:hypothetical protein